MQKKISRKSAAALGAGLMSMSLTGFAGLLMLAPGANAAESEIPADITVNVTSEEMCGWNLVGAPGNFELVTEEGNAEYVGAALVLVEEFTNSDTETLSLYVSGTDQAETSRTNTTACTWYELSGVSPLAPTVEMSFSGNFIATAADNGPDVAMDFTPGAEAARGSVTAAPMLITPTEADATACMAEADTKKFVVTDVSLSVPSTPAPIISMLLEDIGATAATDLGQRCDLGFKLQVTIPESQLPSHPGALYSWAGATLLTSITTALTD